MKAVNHRWRKIFCVALSAVLFALCVSASAQQSSASTQQVAASSEELASMAGELQHLVSEFSL